MLLHLYSEEVTSKFCCLILQLIANMMSIALQHKANPKQLEHPMQICNTSITEILKWFVYRTKHRWEELVMVLIYSKLKINYFTLR